MSPDTVPGCAERLSVTMLNEWRDGILDPAQTQQLNRHLSSCVVCQAQLGEYATLATALRSIRTPEPVHGYGHNPRLRALAPADQRGRASHRVRLRLVSGLGAVAAVLVVALAFAQIFAVLGRRAVTGPLVQATAVPPA